MIIKRRQKQFSLVSKVYRFIRDLRTVDPLPISFQDYQDLIFPSDYKNGRLIRVVGEDRIDYITKVLNKFYKSPNAGDMIGQIGNSLAISYLNGNREGLKKGSKLNIEASTFSFNKIQKLPKRYITDSLGSGMSGVAFDYGKDKVEKISFNPFTKDEMKFYTWQLKNNYSCFPKIYSLEKDQVIEEKLLLDTDKVKRFGDLIDKYTVREMGGRSKVDINKIEDQEFKEFIVGVQRGLGEIFGKSDIGDLHRDNIGERIGTSEIVYFNPVGNNV